MNDLPATQTQSVIETIKAIVPRSFEKTFASIADTAIVAGMQICISDLTQEQINLGILTVVSKGFCPDPALFRRWCLGQDGFDNTDVIADSYVSKAGALSNILAWRADSTQSISVAEKQAYDKTTHMFSQADYNANMTATANGAFKDHYEMIVRELVANKIPCERYIAPVGIQAPKSEIRQIASDDFVDALFKKHGYRGLNTLNKMGSA